MARKSTLLRASLAASWFAACTHDFSGYHLEETGGSPNASGNGGAEQAYGGASSSGGSAAEAGANEAGAGGHGAPTNGGARASGGSAGHTAGAHGGAPAQGGSSEEAGAPALVSPSCAGLPSTCGAEHGANCCASSVVPGGSFERSKLAGAKATLSTFALDDYEVTVGRFRKFVDAYTPGMIASGAGKNPANAELDPGWDGAWNAKLAASASALASAVTCSNGTFTASAGANELLPMTCLNWYEAYAFCIWDGGRLPTEAEWNYAAAGGPEERTYPWGETPPDDTLAVFCPASCSKMQNVGTKPAGKGKWGQLDLAGNVWEWNLDVFANPYAQASCNDCANVTLTSNSQRVFRGGSSGNDSSALPSASRHSRDPSDHNAFVGVRCARSP